MTQPTVYEQYLLELINQARANPSATANAFGIGLNDGLAAGTITNAAKQPLAFNFLLNDAAKEHSQWMIDNQRFQHAGKNGSSAKDRMEDAGYRFTGGWTWGENLGTTGTTGRLNVNNAIAQVDEGLFKSAGHRVNVLNGSFREVGLSGLRGNFKGYDSLLVTENFAKSGSEIFLTGVAFDDSVQDDNFYGVGEGLGGLEVIATRQSDGATFTTTTFNSGGYQLALNPGTYEVSFEQNNLALGSDREITIGAENIKLDLDTSDLTVQSNQTIGEIGTINNLNHFNKTIQLNNSYTNPVVFALPLSYNGGDPGIARITDIQNDNFSLYLQEADYRDGKHTKESLSYMVLEAGSWELEDGTLLEVDNLDTNANVNNAASWADIDFATDFTNAPVILSQVQSNNETQFVRTRQKSSSADGFELAMEEEELYRNSGHSQESIGWLAIESGTGDLNNLSFKAGRRGNRIDHRWDKIHYDFGTDSSPSLFASVSLSYRGGDPVGLRYQNLGVSNVQVKLEEDRSFDSEISHVKESVDFLAIAGSGNLSAAPYDPMTSF